MKCYQHDSGCVWEGELRGMKEHNAQCKYQQTGKEEGMREELQRCHEELYNCQEELNTLKEKVKEVDVLKEKVKEVDVLKEKMESSERQAIQQQQVIEDLAGKVAQMQHLLALKENSSSRSKQGESSGAFANPPGAEKEVERKRKGGDDHRDPAACDKLRKCRLDLLLYVGKQNDVIIDNSNNCVKFPLPNGGATVIASCEPVPVGCKVWYEIACYRMGFHGVTVGWCSENKIASERSSYQLGHDGGSYGFHVDIYFSLHHNMRIVRDYEFTDEKIRKGQRDSAKVHRVGVALDMTKGEILFSVNGRWIKDRFNNIPLDAKLVPAITGGNNASIEVNFGEKEFMYYPPNSTFKSMKDIFP